MKVPDKRPGPGQWAGAIAIGIPLAALGLTFFGIGMFIIPLLPIGVIFLILSGIPGYRVMQKQIAWDVRDQPLDSDVDQNGVPVKKPWED
jgi:hypothetical protein